MKKEDRKIMKDILQHKNLEMNLPVYANSYINATYQYSLIHLVLNYYTMKEIEDDSETAVQDEFLLNVLNEIHTMLYETLLCDEVREDYSSVVEKINHLRDEMTNKMTILTSCTDALQIYEYVLNRVEYGITKENYPVEENELATKVFQYLFRDNDKMVINSKIQMVTAQLPIRMTKSRFFDYLTDTLLIYKGSEKSSVNDFVAMLKSTALLDLPKGYGEDYPEIMEVINIMENVDFKTLDLEGYQTLMEQFSLTTQHLTRLVSNYLLVMEIINDFYATLLAVPYAQKEEASKTCISMLQGLHDAFLSSGEIPEEVDEGFMAIEGKQEMLGEDIMQYESILQDVITEHKDTVSWIMADKIFDNLLCISKLLSNSLFINLKEQDNQSEMADEAYITAMRDDLVRLLTDFFDNHAKEVNRAVMAALFSNMPVLFNSQQEIKDYIEYSLTHCGNSSELMACAKILEEMMEEE